MEVWWRVISQVGNENKGQDGVHMALLNIPINHAKLVTIRNVQSKLKSKKENVDIDIIFWFVVTFWNNRGSRPSKSELASPIERVRWRMDSST